MTADLIALDRHIRDLAPFDLVQEVAERHTRLRTTGRGTLEQIEQGYQQQPDDDPESQVFTEIVHGSRLSSDNLGVNEHTPGASPRHLVPDTWEVHQIR